MVRQRQALAFILIVFLTAILRNRCIPPETGSESED